MITGKWLSRLRQYRQDELPMDIDDWPEDWRDEFEERAAIMDKEFYGSLDQEDSEQWAETIVRALYRLYQKERLNDVR